MDTGAGAVVCEAQRSNHVNLDDEFVVGLPASPEATLDESAKPRHPMIFLGRNIRTVPYDYEKSSDRKTSR